MSCEMFLTARDPSDDIVSCIMYESSASVCTQPLQATRLTSYQAVSSENGIIGRTSPLLYINRKQSG